MKKIIKYTGFLFFSLLSFKVMMAQDVIMLKTGDEIKSKIIELTTDQVKFKKYDNLSGPTYSYNKDEVFKITYEGGRTEVISGAGMGSAGSDNTLVLKKRIAILEFKNKVTKQSVNNGNSHIKYSSPEVSSANLTDMVTTELVNTGKFIVVDRNRIDAILKEQDFNATDKVSQPSSVKLNKILGTQLMLTGSITEFSLKSEKQGGNYIYVSTSKTITTARVVVDLQLINASTGEILFAKSAVGSDSSESSGTKVMGMGENSSSADLTILDKAKREAIQKCVELISEYSSKVPWNGNIAKVNDDNTLVMTPGSSGNVKTGMKFIVYSKGEEVIDPETGLSLGSETKKIGAIEVIADFGLEGKACTAKITSGQGFKAGDIIRVE